MKRVFIKFVLSLSLSVKLSCAFIMLNYKRNASLVFYCRLMYFVIISESLNLTSIWLARSEYFRFADEQLLNWGRKCVDRRIDFQWEDDRSEMEMKVRAECGGRNSRREKQTRHPPEKDETRPAIGLLHLSCPHPSFFGFFHNEEAKGDRETEGQRDGEKKFQISFLFWLNFRNQRRGGVELNHCNKISAVRVCQVFCNLPPLFPTFDLFSLNFIHFCCCCWKVHSIIHSSVTDETTRWNQLAYLHFCISTFD